MKLFVIAFAAAAISLAAGVVRADDASAPTPSPAPATCRAVSLRADTVSGEARVVCVDEPAEAIGPRAREVAPPIDASAASSRAAELERRAELKTSLVAGGIVVFAAGCVATAFAVPSLARDVTHNDNGTAVGLDMVGVGLAGVLLAGGLVMGGYGLRLQPDPAARLPRTGSSPRLPPSPLSLSF